MLNSLKTTIQRIGGNSESTFIRRWPLNPKVAFYGPPNVFREETMQRFAIDLGIPIVSVDAMIENISKNAGQTEELNHPFYAQVKEAYANGNIEWLLKEKIPIKLLRLDASA